METETSGMVGVDEGSNSQPVSSEAISTQPTGPIPPAGYEGTPPELWPGLDGKPPELTPALMRILRGKYFTVRHVTGECGHQMDSINQPRTNCNDCWGVFFSTHPQLVEVAHQFYTTRGRGPMVGLRGEKFVKFFEKYMSLLYQQAIERKKQEESTC